METKDTVICKITGTENNLSIKFIQYGHPPITHDIQ